MNLSNQKEAQYILRGKKMTEIDPKPKDLLISTDLKNETFFLNTDTFSHAIAVGNYTDVYLTDKDKLICHTFRITLSTFETQLDALHLMRCHRSYLVNLKKVANVTGNAQGLKLNLNDNESLIPVSRKYISAVRQFFSTFS